MNRRCVWFQSPSLRGSGRFKFALQPKRVDPQGFNPLHCGAVVASDSRGVGPAPGLEVSIPFIAGQWSLPSDESSRRSVAPRVSIPFIAGQWSLRLLVILTSNRVREVSIPFIAGQWSLPGGGSAGEARPRAFQSPSLRGSGRFLMLLSILLSILLMVSIPFIAGQWSLHGPRAGPAS